MRCAVTGNPIPLQDLKYWNVELQEAYASGEISFKRGVGTEGAATATKNKGETLEAGRLDPAHILDSQNDFAHMIAGLDSLMSVPCLIEPKRRIHKHLQSTCLKQRPDLIL